MYYIVLPKFLWKYAKQRGFLKDNGRYGIMFVKSHRMASTGLPRKERVS